MRHIKFLLGGTIIVILSLSVWPISSIADVMAYQGCKIENKENDILYVQLNPELIEGTDMACQDTIELIYDITKDGYRVVVTNDDWTPIQGWKQPISHSLVTDFKKMLEKIGFMNLSTTE